MEVIVPIKITNFIIYTNSPIVAIMIINPPVNLAPIRNGCSMPCVKSGYFGLSLICTN